MNVMQKFALAAAAVLMTSAIISAPSFAAKRQAATPRSFNQRVQLAMSRGFTYSDLYDGTRYQVRNFIRHCMAGQQS